MKDSQIFVRISEKDRDDFKKQCQDKDLVPSEVLRYLIRAFNNGELNIKTTLET